MTPSHARPVVVLGAGAAGLMAAIFADLLIAEAGVDPQRPLAGLRREERARLVTALTRYPLPWTGDEGYRKAEVTGGGVELREVDPRTPGEPAPPRPLHLR